MTLDGRGRPESNGLPGDEHYQWYVDFSFSGVYYIISFQAEYFSQQTDLADLAHSATVRV
jgi:hypothetical protein